MPIATTYTIRNTNGTLTYTITVASAVGPVNPTPDNSNDPETDLTFYGYGRVGWGQEVDQNFFSLLENFACEQYTSSPTVPKNPTNTPGYLGRGIENPLIGQGWWNLDGFSGLGNPTGEFYICLDNITNTWRHIISQDYADATYVSIADAGGVGPFLLLNGSNSPMTGPIDLGNFKITSLATPTSNFDSANKKYVDDSITAALTTAGDIFVHKAGDIMTGALSLEYGTTDCSISLNILTGDSPNIQLGSFGADSVPTTSTITFCSVGSSTHQIDSQIVAEGGSVGTDNQGSLTLFGNSYVDRYPTAQYQIAPKGWVEQAITTAINGIGIANYLPLAGGTMKNSSSNINMNGAKVTNMALPTVGSDAATKSYVDANAYYPSGQGGTHQVWIAGYSPSNGSGNEGDIWFQM